MIEIEKNNKFEIEVYKKNGVYDIVSSAYFQLNVEQYYTNNEIKKFIVLAEKDINIGLKFKDYEYFFNLLLKNDVFYSVVRDIYLNKKGIIA